MLTRDNELTAQSVAGKLGIVIAFLHTGHGHFRLAQTRETFDCPAFDMISMKIAGKPHAKVSECSVCHQTTSWNDIQRVGFYKPH